MCRNGVRGDRTTEDSVSVVLAKSGQSRARRRRRWSGARLARPRTSADERRRSRRSSECGRRGVLPCRATTDQRRCRAPAKQHRNDYDDDDDDDDDDDVATVVPNPGRSSPGGPRVQIIPGSYTRRRGIKGFILPKIAKIGLNNTDMCCKFSKCQYVAVNVQQCSLYRRRFSYRHYRL